MRYPDVKITTQTEYEFWEKVLGLIQYQLDDMPPIPERCYAFYVHALASKHEDPFKHTGMEHISKELEKQLGSPISYVSLRNYKSRVKKLGWLTKGGKFPLFITKLRETYRQEKEQGIKSFSLIMQITCS